ncbi:single-stranded DNA-binding protein [Synechococcus elongatus]|uniref:Single-stranded DNA-binding protein n=2 Tax=Synechococcus elongatus TaxID=32046 RepID=A0AAN1QLY3_SYNEL|nr:single-stranded DNA-binding protein [Synechococcus elongatus]AZB71769.1 single-stranded DNA-binding protein [Synechococcus elongatus PCC 11801]QFZ91449.1 single-stranded DNA-binding protein [Synechococcus elongatus PCC 11802]
MNSCILQATVVEAPQLRYTQDNQTPVAEMVVQFPGLSSKDAPSRLKVVGWGSVAQELQDRCRTNDEVVLEGRLKISSLLKPDGSREKVTELTVSRVHHLSLDSATGILAQEEPEPRYGRGPAAPAPVTASPTVASTTAPDVDYDDIPF